MTPALSAAATRDEYTLEGGRVRVAKQVTSSRGPSSSSSSSLVTVISTATVDPVALGDQGFYVCRVARSGGSVGEEQVVRRMVEVLPPASSSAFTALEWDTAAFNPEVSTPEGTAVRWVLGLRARGFHPRVDWFGPDGDKIDSDRVSQKLHCTVRTYRVNRSSSPTEIRLENI